MSARTWKVGELAAQTSVSVRTLHHYDEIGLLTPSGRTASAHRLYSEADVVRLQKIRSLQHLGFSLEQVRALLDDPDCSTRHVIEMHTARLREQVDAQQRLCDRLERIADRLGDNEQVSVEEFLQAIKEIQVFEKYYTAEQLAELDERGRQLGEERLRAAEQEWKDLIAAVRGEMQKGTSPDDPRMQALARQWNALIEEFTGGNPEIRESLRRMYRDNPNAAADKGHTHDPQMAEYVGQAMRSLGDPS
jgi:DNA-binding transcriptional MerR regulator